MRNNSKNGLLVKKLEKGSRPFFFRRRQKSFGCIGCEASGVGCSSRLSFLSQTSKGVRLDGWEEEKRREREEEKEGEIRRGRKR
jgi:hypothetical protein